jgi:hypothetical protein
MERLFIADEKEFAESKKWVDRVFNTEQELPEQVFQESFHGFKFEEFDWAMGEAFWSVLQDLCRKSEDAYCLMGVLNPDPVRYFYKAFGRFSWVKLPVDLTADEYFSVLAHEPAKSPADAILYHSYTVVWVPPSGKWGIWGERDMGVCVLGFRDEKDGWHRLPFLNHWHPINETVFSWMSLNFSQQQLPGAFVQKMKLNYPM